MFNLITSEIVCGDVAQQLGYTYEYRKTEVDLPAGCIYDAQSSLIYFNTEINPSNTNPKPTWGGVCKGKKPEGILCNPFFYFGSFYLNLSLI